MSSPAQKLDDPAMEVGPPSPGRQREDIRFWRDGSLGEGGVELLTGRCFEHRYRPHFHAEVVVAVFTGGAQRHTVGRHQGIAGPGHVLIIPAGETHTGQAEHAAGWSYRAFYPNLSTLRSVRAEVFKGGAAGAPDFGTSPLHADHRFARKLARLHRIIEASATEPLARQQAFAAAMSDIIHRYAEGDGAIRLPLAEPTAVRRARAYIEASFTDPGLAVADIAAAAGLSPYHFMRSFRAATGVTAHAFVTNRRLACARELLVRGEPAAGVAHAVGFADQSHLIRRFRAAFGVTPGQYARASRRLFSVAR